MFIRILMAIIIASLIILPGFLARCDNVSQKENNMVTLQNKPLIDTMAPASTLTATFALG